jgi:predicted CXXCH cytochrome family protein
MRRVLWSVPGLVALASCGEPFHEETGAATFVLPGPHAVLTCEQCHGPPPYQAFVWDTTCLSCHEVDRKTPDHYAGQGCSESGCHLDTDPTWADNHGVPHDFLPLEGVHSLDCTSCHDSGTPSNDDVFPEGGSRYSCAGCHEDDRLTPTHYVEPGGDLPYGALLGWDCNACHDQELRKGLPIDPGWTDFGDHGEIRFPHGTEAQGTVLPPTAWVVACTDCHPDQPPIYTCTTSCHAEIFVEPRLACHNGLEPGQNDGNCTTSGCHIYADIRTVESGITDL